jgi:hypothetical protein
VNSCHSIFFVLKFAACRFFFFARLPPGYASSAASAKKITKYDTILFVILSRKICQQRDKILPAGDSLKLSGSSVNLQKQMAGNFGWKANGGKVAGAISYYRANPVDPSSSSIRL